MNDRSDNLIVLLVEPDWETAKEIKSLLRGLNEPEVSISHVRTGEEALKSIDTTLPDVVLLDDPVDGREGPGLARTIRQRYFEVPVIATTDDGDEQRCAAYFRAGADDYRVISELDPDVLHGAIKQALTRRSNRVRQKQTTRLDPLTGTYSDDFTFERIQEEMIAAVRHDRSFSLCLMDVDGFSTFNKRHGHLAGDVLLEELARKITGWVRDEDIVGRSGADSFLIGLRDMGSSEAYGIAQEISEAIQSSVFCLPGHVQAEVTCSIGVAEFDGGRYAPEDEMEPPKAFFNRVEQVLHHARRQEPGCVERRRYERYTADGSVPVTLLHREAKKPVELRDYSSGGVRLDEAPALQEGERITLVFHPEYGPEIKKQGIIRSCEAREGSSRALLGVKVNLPLEMMPDEDGSGFLL